MLASLSIRDVVIIDRLDLEFPEGLCALTGETGAGKSILLDALGLGLGGRGDLRLLRHGAAQATVSARFLVPADHPAQAILDENGLAGGEVDGEHGVLELRRVLGGDGRSRAFVNDQAVGVGLLRRIGETLVEIHGQYDNQRLLDPAEHRRLLDAFAGLGGEVQATASSWHDWQAARTARAEAEQALIIARRDEAFLRHAVDEISDLSPQPGEEAQLAARRATLMHAEKLMQALQDAIGELEPAGGRGVGEALRQALRTLERHATKAEGRLDPIIAALERGLSEVTEAADGLARIAGDADLDPRHLEEVEERLFALRALARKHAVAAGVADDVHFQQTPMAELRSSKKYGCIIANPPYGERLGQPRDIEPMYREMGKVFAALDTWSIYVLTAIANFERLYGRSADRRRKLYNSNLACTYYQYFGPKPPSRRVPL